MLETIKYNKK